MSYKELIKSGADATDIQQYLVDGEMTASPSVSRKTFEIAQKRPRSCEV